MASNNDFSILLNAIINKSGITTELKQVQQIVNKYSIDIMPELKTASLRNQMKSVSKDIANDFNKTFGTNLTGNDVFKAFENQAKQATKSINDQKKAIEEAKLAQEQYNQKVKEGKALASKQANDASLTKQKSLYDEIASNQKQVYSLKQKLISSSEFETEELNKQIGVLEKRNKYLNYKINKSDLSSSSYEKELSASKQIYENQLKIKQASVVDTSINAENKKNTAELKKQAEQLEKNRKLALEYTKAAQTQLNNAISKYSYGDTSSASALSKQMGNGVTNFSNLNNVETEINSYKAKIEGIIQTLEQSHKVNLNAINEEINAEKKLASDKQKMEKLQYDATIENANREKKLYVDAEQAYKTNAKMKIAAENKVQAKLKQTAKDQQSAFNLKSGKVQLNNNISAYLRENTKLTDDLKNKLINLQNQISSVDKTGLNKLQQEFKETTSQARALGASGKSAFDELKSNLKSFATFVFGGGILMGAVNSVRQMVSNVAELDNQLLELSKVTDLSANGLSKVVDQAYALGDAVGKTGTSALSTITDFVRAGYSLQESMGLAEEALKMTNVSENITDASVAAEDLVHILNGLGESAGYAKTINDAINEVSNTQAVDFDNLVDGATRLSAVAKQAGVSFQQMLGILTAGYATLGDMEKVASGAITIFTRLQSIQMDGEEGVETVAKLQKEFSGATNGVVNIVDKTTGQLRGAYDILNDLDGVWSSLDKNTQEALAFDAAGTRQKAVFLSILDNWKLVKDSVQSATDSMGSSDKENAKYLSSLSGKVEAFKSKYQELSQEVVNGDFLKVIVSSGTGALSVLTQVIDKLGLFPTLLATISGALSATKNIGFFQTTDSGNGITNLFAEMANKSKLAETAIDEVGVALENYNTNVRTSAIELDGFNKLQSTDTMTTYLQSLKGGEATLQGYNASLKTTTASTIGLKVATAALNIGIMAIAAIGIQLLIKGFDALVTTTKEQQEALETLQSEYETNTSNVKSLSEQLADCKKSLEELNDVGGAKVVDDSQKTKLEEQRKELESQLAIAKELERASGLKAEQKATQILNSTVQSEYQTSTHYGAEGIAEQDFDYVTKDKELQNVTKAYDEYANKVKVATQAQSKLKANTPEWKAQQKIIDENSKSMDNARDYASKLADGLQTERKSLIGATDEGNKWSSTIDNTLNSYTNWSNGLDDVTTSTDRVTSSTDALTISATEASTAVSGIFTDDQNKSIDTFQTSIKSIGDALSNLSSLSTSDILDLMQQFPDFDWKSFGINGVKGIGNLTGALQALATEQYNSLDPMIKSNAAIKSLYTNTLAYGNAVATSGTALQSYGDIIDNVSSNVKLIANAQYELSKSGKLSSDTVSGLLKVYPKLQNSLTLTSDGYTVTKGALDDLITSETAQYKTELDTAKKSAEEVYGAESLKQDGYDGTTKSLIKIAKARVALAQLDVADAESAFNKTGRGNLSSYKPYTDATGILAKYQTALNGVAIAKTNLNNANDIVGQIGKDTTEDLTGKEKTDLPKAYQTARAKLDHLHDIGKVKDSKYYSELAGLEKKYLSGHKEYQSEIWSIDKSIYDYKQSLVEKEKKAQEDKIKSQFDNLDYEHNIGKKTDKEYYKTRLDYANKYYKKDGEVISDYLDEYRSIYSDYYKWQKDTLQNQIDEMAQKVVDAREKIIDAYNSSFSNIKDIASNQAVGSDEQLSTYTDGIHSATEAITYYRHELLKLNGMYKAGILSENDYTEQTNTLKDAISDATSSIKDFQDSIADNLSNSLEQITKAFEDGYDKQSDVLNKEKDAYGDVIDAQKKILELKENQYEYEKSIADKTKDISKIESRMAELQKAAQTGDRNAQKELGELNDDLADKKEDLSDTQHKHEVDLENDSLDTALDNNNKIVEAQISSAEEVKNQKIADITEIYNKEIDLIKNSANYTDETFGVLLRNYAAQLATLGVVQSEASLNSIVQAKNYSSTVSSPAATIISNSASRVTNIVSNIISKMKKGSFSNGGYVDASSVGEDGYALVKHGEPILTVEQGKLFKELVSNMQPLNNLVKLNTPNLSNVITNNTNSSPIININLPASTTIDNSAVNNYRKFIPEITKAVSDEILNAGRQYK